MEIERPNTRELTPKQAQHLEKLRAFVTAALEDGKLTESEIAGIKSIIEADHSITLEELRTVYDTVHAVMGDAAPTLDWQS